MPIIIILYLSLALPDTVGVNKVSPRGIPAADLASASGHLPFVDLSQVWTDSIYSSKNLSGAAGQHCLHHWTKD